MNPTVLVWPTVHCLIWILIRTDFYDSWSMKYITWPSLLPRWAISLLISSCAPHRCLSAEKIWLHGLGFHKLLIFLITRLRHPHHHCIQIKLLTKEIHIFLKKQIEKNANSNFNFENDFKLPARSWEKLEYSNWPLEKKFGHSSKWNRHIEESTWCKRKASENIWGPWYGDFVLGSLA